MGPHSVTITPESDSSLEKRHFLACSVRESTTVVVLVLLWLIVLVGLISTSGLVLMSLLGGGQYTLRYLSSDLSSKLLFDLNISPKVGL